MMVSGNAVRRWFLQHWFGGMFVIIGAVWVITSVAYYFGAQSITFPNRYGTRPTIDFMREHDQPVVALREGVGLELHTGGSHLSGSIVLLTDGLPVLCWICGTYDTHGGISQVAFRTGDWFYRAPDDHRLVDLRSLPAAVRDAFRTVAYNRATGERVMLRDDAGTDEQAAALASRGLAMTEANRLRLETIADLPPVSMMREGCVIFQLAFAAVVALWFVVGGLAWILVRLFRRLRVKRGPASPAP